MTPESDVDEPRLSVAAAARRLGVAPATLRTWARRYGLGPSEHQPGKHRRYTPADVARLELMQRALVRGASPADAARYASTAPLPSAGLHPHPAAGSDGAAPAAREPGPRTRAAPVAGPAATDGSGAPAAGDAAADEGPDDGDAGGARLRVGGRVLRLPGAGRRARGLGRAALALDDGLVRTVLAESIEESGVVRTWDAVARPVLAAVADRWAYSGAGVEIEHLLSECVISVFGAHAGAVAPAEDLRPALMAGMPGEHHTLPMIVLTAALADHGVVCRALGPNLPLQALVSSIRRTAPVAVVLWSQLADTADTDLLRALPRTRPPYRTFAAGPGWQGAELPPRVARLDSLETACTMISSAVLV